MSLVRKICALLVGLFGCFGMLNWFMWPKDDLFWRNGYAKTFLPLPIIAGVIAALLYPRADVASRSQATYLTLSYGLALLIFVGLIAIAVIHHG